MAPLAGLLALGALAQGVPATRISGTVTAIFPAGGGTAVTFNCDFASGASGPCTGSYSASIQEAGCSNTFKLANAIAISGLNLTQPGPIQGSVTATNADYEDTGNPDGTCSIVPGTFRDFADTFTGTWDGTTGLITFSLEVDSNGMTYRATGTFTAVSTAPPVFPMLVTASIDSSVANARADIQFRAQDVGTVGSVYAFAIAPATIVQPAATPAADFPTVATAKSRSATDASVPCVLAQLNASGQLQQVSSANLQAFVTGVLSSQGQAVAVINGVATVNIAGAVFYVGYGPNATTMLNGGINRRVVGAPGTIECNPAAPATGWWWNRAEGGRGYSIEVQGNHIFYAAFLYDDTGRSNWYVATGSTSLDGSLFTGDLLRVSGGQSLGGAYRAPTPAQSVGPFTLAFDTASTGTMVWPGGTVAIERFNIVTNGIDAAPRANQPETGWWWNPAESGRGFFIEWQDGFADLAGYMYDDAGNAVWYLSVFQTPDIRAFNGSWWLYANGQSLTGAYKPATKINDNVAPVSIQFTSATTATLMLPNGRSTNLIRHRF